VATRTPVPLAALPGEAPAEPSAPGARHSVLTPGASVLRGAAFLFSTQPITWAATLLTVMLLPRYLTAAALGEITIALTLTMMAGTVTALGIPDYLVRHVATRPDEARRETGAAVLLLAVVSTLVGAVLVAAAPALAPGFARQSLLVILVVGLVVQAFQSPLLSLVRGQEHHGRFAWLQVGVAVAPAMLGLPVLARGGDVVAYAAATLVANALVTVGIGLAAGFRPSRAQCDPHLWLRLARGGLAFMAMNLTLTMRGNLDRLLLGAFANSAAVGWYAAAGRIAAIPIFVPTLVMTPLLPVLSRCRDDQEAFLRTLRRSVDLVLTLTLPISAMMVGVAPAVPGVLGWSPEFASSIPLIMILAVQVLFVALNMVLGTALIASHKEQLWLGVYLAAAVFNLALNWLSIPYFERTTGNGAIGAAGTTLLTEILMLGGALLILPRGTIGVATAVRGAKLGLAAVALAGIAYGLQSVSLPLAILAGGLEWVAATLLIGSIRPADLRMVYRLATSALSRRDQRAV
jgi:O-antigen/teichoic acid export membrane protein